MISLRVVVFNQFEKSMRFVDKSQRKDITFKAISKDNHFDMQIIFRCFYSKQHR